MVRELVSPSETSAALDADERFLLGVDSRVQRQGVFPRKGFSALDALETFLNAMLPHMQIEVAFSVEFFPAVAAAGRHRVRVDFRVPNQIFVAGEI